MSVYDRHRAEVCDSADILQVFTHFYRELYLLCALSVVRPCWGDSLVSYLDDIDLPMLTNGDCAALEADITVEEVEGAISSFAPRKSPGLDGFPSEWNHTFGSSLAPPLLRVFAKARLDGRLPLPMREALVVLIHKGGKYPRECDSYRPISLMNVDT